MKKVFLPETKALLATMLDALLATAAASVGQDGSELRRVIGDTSANADTLLLGGTISASLSLCFETARLAGASLSAMGSVRQIIMAEAPVSSPAIGLRSAGLVYCLAQEAKIITALTFTSRQDVDDLVQRINVAYDDAETEAADDMSSDIYRALIALHASVVHHLVETARPLPQMIDYALAAPLPTLVLAQMLYAEPSRADELRDENKVVHPAFPPVAGKALSR
jgi:hypothetical protein